MEPKNSTFFLVGNIPPSFRSAGLRTYFSNFVEKKFFNCFHYRHRPEQLREDKKEQQREVNSSQDFENGATVASSSLLSSSVSLTNKSGATVTSKCCVVALVYQKGEEFMHMYHSKNWSQADGGLLPWKVHITRLDVVEGGNPARSKSSIPWEDLAVLPELNPPSVMPQGNVGTSLSTFMGLIQACKLPAYLIKKLQLEFPRSRSSKRYGAVEYDYGTLVDPGCIGDDTLGSANDPVEEGGRSRGKTENEDSNSDTSDDKIPSDDDHDAEEWERYEAFHEDIDKQERTKERLFEEELEVVWEKGGSGLVFYTDASHWDQQDGDFDEKCSQEDDWDVDMSVYYDPAGGNKDARDMREMEKEQRLREGECSESWKGVAGFEKHTKGIGSKLLRRSGWTAGSGVGATNQGIAEPIESEGQLPFIKRGLGYRGEKLERLPFPKRKRKAMKDVIISTVYDRPEEEESTILRTAPPSVLKHREVRFMEGGLLRPNTGDSTPTCDEHGSG